jgi:hypothetical protein
LLNVIEKSKGFSDTMSTTAARRLRNKIYPYNNLSFENNSKNNFEKFCNSENNKKVNKLKWNEDKQELEFSEKEIFDNNIISNTISKENITFNNGEVSLKPKNVSAELELNKQNSSFNNGN